MTVNANYKTQVQARIDAVTGATPLSDLIKLQTAARGLACNIAPLAAQINARLSAAGGATPLTDLAMMGILAEGNSRYAYYTVPFAVDKGDRLFIDAFGAVTKESMTASATAGATFEVFNEVAEFAAIPQMSVRPFSNLDGGTMRGAGAVLRLANGNHLVIRPYRRASNSYGSVSVHVLSADFSQLLSQTLYDVSVAMSVTGVRIFGAFEVSTNTFRIYFTSSDGVTADHRIVSFFSLAYNPATHAVTGAAGSNVFTGAADRDYTVSYPHKQGDRYLILSGSYTSTDVRRLDMQAGTATSTTVGAGANFDAPDHSGATNVWTRMVIGTAVTMVRLDGVDNIALPANLAADGCFGSTWRVRHLGNRRWLATNGTAVKLVTFGTNYTSCDIYTLDAAFGAAGVISIGAVLVDGNRFYVAIGATTPVMISFVFTGAATPTEYVKLKTPAVAVARVISALSRAPNIAATDRVVTSLMFAATASTTQRNMATYTAPASVYTGLQSRVFATSLTAAAAGQVVEVELAEGTTLTTSSLSTADIKRQQFLETQLRHASHVARAYAPSVSAGNAELVAGQSTSGRVNIGSSAVLLKPDTEYLITGTSGTSSNLLFIHPTGLLGWSVNSASFFQCQSQVPTLLLTQDFTSIASEEPLA